MIQVTANEGTLCMGSNKPNMTVIGQLSVDIFQFEHFNFISELWFLGQKLCHTGPLIRTNV